MGWGRYSQCHHSEDMHALPIHSPYPLGFRALCLNPKRIMPSVVYGSAAVPGSAPRQ